MPNKILNFLLGAYKGIFKRIKRQFEKARQFFVISRKRNIEKKLILMVFKKKRFPRFAQFAYLLRFLSKKEKVALAAFGCLAAAGIFGLASMFYLNITKSVPASGGEYIEGIVGYPRFINPLYSRNNDVDEDLVFLTYSGLTSRTERGGIALNLAKEYRLSEDEKTYTFILKDNLKWSDGRPLTADDVLFTVEAIKNEKYQSPLRLSWQSVKLKKIDNVTIEFQLDKPYGLFPDLVSVGIVPKHIWEKIPTDNINQIYSAAANIQPVGSGPYAFKSLTKDRAGVIKTYVLEKNKYYSGTKPNIERITFKFYPDSLVAADALDSRQIDGLAFASAEIRNALKLKNRFNSHIIALPRFDAIFFNTKENALLKDIAVRKALALAIDRKKVIDQALKGDAVLDDGPIPPGFPGYDDKNKQPGGDMEAAKNILVSAGWTLKDANAFRTNKKNVKLQLTLTTIDTEQDTAAAKMIQQWWQELGVETELKIVPAADIVKNVIDGRSYEALLFGEMYGPDLDPYPYWHTSALRSPGLNLAQYSNPKVDALLEQARQTADQVVRQKKYEEFQALLAEDFPTIFLWQPNYVYLIDKKVHGVDSGIIRTSSDRLRSVISGYISTKRTLK